MKKEVKIIFHVDLNAFFATCALNVNPHLKNKIFVVGGSKTSRKGVISSASYKARKLKINSGMSIVDALAIYPKLEIVETDFLLYNKYSNDFFSFLKKYSDKILKGSIDEAYMDVSRLAKKVHPLKIAKEIQTNLNKIYKLPCSIGIAPTLFLAKMASDMKKPLGITIMRKKDVEEKLFPISIRNLYGIGSKTYPFLERAKIMNIGDFVNIANKEKILEILKEETYNDFLDHIYGRSSDIVDPDKYSIPKSISNEKTFSYNVDNASLILEESKKILLIIHQRLVNEDLLAKGLTIKLKSANFRVITRSRQINDYSDSYEVFENLLEELFFDKYNNEVIRLIGVGFINIIPLKNYKLDYNLFNYQKFLK